MKRFLFFLLLCGAVSLQGQTALRRAAAIPTDNTVPVLDAANTIPNVTETPVTIDPGTGNIATPGTVDGRDIATDGSKLDGIEALADVTDTANVTAAGALMDSEVDADIKTLTIGASASISGPNTGDQDLSGYQPLATVLTNTTASYTTAEETKLGNIAAGATVGATWGSNITSQPAIVAQGEAEAGVATTERIWTAQRVGQAIAALAGGGTDDQTAAEVPVVTTSFGVNFANDASHNSAQELFDIIDNFSLGGNDLGSSLSSATDDITSTGNLNLVPAAGSAVVIDGTTSFDGGVITGITSLTGPGFIGINPSVDNSFVRIAGGLNDGGFYGRAAIELNGENYAGGGGGISGRGRLTADLLTIVEWYSTGIDFNQGLRIANGTINSDDTTQSTMPTDGAIHTDGGLGVAKNAYVGGNVVATGTVAGSNLSGTNTGDNTVATTGDSATAFFGAGEIEHERGGLEADASAYSGLVGINAGATVEVDTIAEFDTMLGLTGTPSGATWLSGDGSWSTPAGSGDVSKVGTPVDDQVGVWTGNGTIEGTSGLTFAAGTLTSTEFVGGGSGLTGVTAAHANTITWTGTPLLETGATFTFGDGTDATLTHTYANTGTDVSIAYSTGAMAVTGTLSATALSGPLTGDVTGNVSGTAATVTGAAQAAITSVGTLTTLAVDNITINGNDISSTAGVDLTITPLAGQQIVLDGTVIIDEGVVTGATSISSTAFVGALTGNADTATTATTAATANAGDLATGFFSIGTIEHERGGLEADASAYSGLVGINAGATVEVDTIAELDTMLGLTGTPSAATYLAGDGSWATPGGSGDVTAAVAFAVDNVLIKSDGTSKGVQATGISVDDSDNITGVAAINADSFKVLDAVDQSHGLSFVVASDQIADKTFTYTGLYNFGMTLSADTSVTFPTTGTLISSEVDPTVDTEAEIEAITGALFGASKVVTSGNMWVADGTDFESVAMSGDATIATGGAITIGADKILESHLKAVNAATDEYVLTYEATTGDFEWQVDATGGSPADLNDIGNVTLTTPAATHVLAFTGTANASANRALADADIPNDITIDLATTATTATHLAGGSGGTIPYQSSAGTTVQLANGTAGQVLSSQGTTLAPQWIAAAGGGDVSDGGTLSTGLTFPAAGLHVLDTNASHDLIITPGSDITADRVFTITTGDSARTLTMTGDASVEGTNTGDQTTAPTQSAGDNDTSIATTAFVQQELDSKALVCFPLTIDTLADAMDYGIGYVPAAFTITRMVFVHAGAGLSTPSVSVTVRQGTSRSAVGTAVVTGGTTVTSSTTGSVITSFTDATCPAASFLWVETASTTGTTANLEVFVFGTYD